MIERDELTIIPNIKDPSKSTVHYGMGIDIARNNFCDTLMEYLSDVNFINPLSFKQRERVLNEQLYILESVCRKAFREVYRE